MTAAAALLWALGGLYVVWPLLSDAAVRAGADEAGEKTDASSPILDQIADLDLEYAAGKIPEETYQKVRRDLMREVIGAEAREKSGIQDQGAGASPARWCSSCGVALRAEDRFCTDCGKKVVS